MPLTAGPELDARIAEWMGTPFRQPRHGVCCTCQVCGWDHDNCKCYWAVEDEMMCQLLDTLIARGYEPALVYRKHAGWGLQLYVDEHIAGDRWQPTRALAACAAVVALMEGEDAG